ncbi:MAG: class I SAM-dependent methyltransferase [Rubrivivax sp.]|nr:class I SAM-dependent methyltransferase [Rubrivivax sp.]
MNRRHLDIGCGGVPRNPFKHEELYGVDLFPPASDARVLAANLALQPIPFADQHFDSLSAYDFFEHIPRVLPTADQKGTRFPFVELMNEVWRVLKPGGRLYASTPVYPSQAAFTDPTHVNVLTLYSHRYFTLPDCTARMYGFKGAFRAHTVHLATPTEHSIYIPPPAGAVARFKHRVAVRRGHRTHVIWELEAVRPA